MCQRLLVVAHANTWLHSEIVSRWRKTPKSNVRHYCVRQTRLCEKNCVMYLKGRRTRPKYNFVMFFYLYVLCREHIFYVASGGVLQHPLDRDCQPNVFDMREHGRVCCIWCVLFCVYYAVFLVHANWRCFTILLGTHECGAIACRMEAICPAMCVLHM